MLGELIPFFAITMVFSIPVIAIWTDHRRKLAKIEAETAAKRAAPVNQDLEDRVRVLERIVTDRGYDLASQIEALRDERKLDARAPAARTKESL